MSKMFEALERAGRNSAPLLSAQPRTGAKPATGSPPADRNGASNAEPGRRIRSVSVHLAEPAIFPFDNGNSSAAEQYRMIRTRIVCALKPGSLLLMSSSTSGDGKTITALNIGCALALKNDSNILIVDGDLCRAMVARKLEIAQTPGLVDILQGTCLLEEALVRIDQIPNLYILAAGKAGEKRTELFESPRWKALCSVFRAQFAYTVIDAPPIGAVADYELLQNAADGVAMVVRPDHTERSLCLNALETIPKDKFLGVVFNAADRSTISTNYGYYYDSYYQGKKPAQ